MLEKFSSPSNLTRKHTMLLHASHTLCTHSNGENKHFNVVSGIFSTKHIYKSNFRGFFDTWCTLLLCHWTFSTSKHKFFRKINTYADSSCCIQSTFRRTFTSKRAWCVFAYPINTGVRFTLVNI